MAINPELITTIRVDQLPDETLSLTNLIPHSVGTDLKSATIQELVDLVATAIGVSGGVGYVAISVTDGQQLPDVPELPSFFLCGAGTYLNINGYPDVICTDELNAIMSLTDHWQLAVGIPIVAEVGVQTVTGSAVDNTDPLNPIINEIIDGVQTIVAGTNITVDNTDPSNPIVNATGGGGTPTLQEVATEGNTLTDTEILFDSAFGNKEILMNVDDGIYVKDIDSDKLAFIEHSGLGISNYDGTNTTNLLEEGFSHTSSGGFQKLTFDTIASNEEIIIPNASGTLALTTDIPTLQEVTTEGSETSNSIKVIDTGNTSTQLQANGIVFDDLDDLGSTVLSFQQTSEPIQQVVEIRGLGGTMALLSDIPTGGGIPHATAAGTDTYTATITGVTAYNDGDAFLIRFTNGNTTSATLNVNSLGAIPLYRNNDGALLGGDIIDGGEMLCIYNSTNNNFQVIGIAPNSLFAYVTNDDSVTLTKGMPVYAFSGTGDRMTVKRANNSADATSAQTVGLVLSTSIASGQKGLIMMQGLLDGLSILPTSTYADGDAIYLGATAGTITNVKPYAPNHLVYLGVVTTANNGSAGRMYVRIQNGYELSEIHDVDLISNAPTNNQGLIYESSTDLWKNKTIIEDSITNGVTDKAPSQNAVFDALALKADTYPNYPFNTTTNYFGLFDIVPTISTSVTIGSTANNTNSAVAFNRFSVDKEITISDFAILQNAANDGASATVTLYIFDDTNAGLPGVKLHQETTATGILTPAQKYISFTNNITLQKGNYWIALHFRGLNTAGTNPSFIGGLVNQPNVVTSIASYGINFRPLITGATADLSNNPTITLGSVQNLPQIFIKI
jgi:hypothetical protein